MLFCSLTKEITPKICRLCVCVKINKRSSEPFMCLDPNKQRSFSFFNILRVCVFGSCFRTLSVILVSDLKIIFYDEDCCVVYCPCRAGYVLSLIR